MIGDADRAVAQGATHGATTRQTTKTTATAKRPAIRRLLVEAFLVALLVAPSAPAFAHELGKGRVVAVIDRDGRYDVSVTVDPDALLTRLQAFDGQVPEAATSVQAQARWIRALLPVYLRHTNLLLDGVLQTPVVEYVSPHERPGGGASTAESGLPGVVRLVGKAAGAVTSLQFGTSMMLGSYALAIESPDGAPGRVHWLAAGATSEPLALAPVAPVSVMGTVTEYLWLGFTHILPKGLDHILFVVGLFLLSTTWRALLAQVTAFTVAHSVTLALAMAGAVRAAPSVVEPLIALSIAYVAVENLVASRVSPWRVAVVFTFGLLHGLGFAGVLSELGLPDGQLITALVSFNVGVEAGQVAIVALAWLLVGSWRSEPRTYRRFVVAPASMAMAITGLYWTVQRLY